MTTVRTLLSAGTLALILSIQPSVYAELAPAPRDTLQGEILERHFDLQEPQYERDSVLPPPEEMLRMPVEDQDLREVRENTDFDMLKKRFEQPLDENRMLDRINEMVPEYQDEFQEIARELISLQEAQSELLKNGFEHEEAAAYARELQEEIKNLKAGLKDLHANLKQDPDLRVAASIITQPSEEESAAYDVVDVSDEDFDDLSDLESELAYREELIAQLLEELESGDSSSSLEANLLAIQNYPVASGGLAIFALVTLWLFRGRIAELSGFGIKISFKSKNTENSDKK